MHINALTHKDRIVIVGAGGHGKVVADAVHATGAQAHICFADDGFSLHGQHLLSFEIIGTPSEIMKPDDAVHIAIGNNRIREKLFTELNVYSFLSVAHPTAVVSQWSVHGPGSFFASGAIVGPDARLGIGVIVNHGAVVDHDCQVGDFSHIAPGASLAGGVVIGTGVFVGAGARVLPGIRVGSGAVIGAGAVVTKDVEAGAKVKGVPAEKF